MLKHNCEVIGHVKPNSKVKSLINSVPEYVSKLTNKDVLIFIGGSNDIEDNSIEGYLSDINQFVTKNGHTNIILGEIPNRYNTSGFSAVNQKIMVLNRKLKKYRKSNTHVDIMETVQERKYYTNHGFIMNALGKDALCLKLRVIIDEIFMSNNVLQIPLKLKKNYFENTLYEEDITVNNMSKDEVHNKKTIQDCSDGSCDKPQDNEKYTVLDRNENVSNNNTNSITPMTIRSSMRKKVSKNLSNDFLWAK
jgi:hypothetical protein